jgi:hypothetical protein
MRTAPLPRGLLAVAVLVLAAASGLTSCANGSTTTITNAVPEARLVVLSEDRTSGTTPATPATRPPTPAFVLAVSRDDLVRETRERAIELVASPDDARLVHVRYLGGSPECHGARVTVDEGTAMVRIVLFSGVLPEASGVACPAVALPRQIDVHLDRPLGSRELIAL